MLILKANELQIDPREQMSRIFVDGFYQWLQHFTKDKEKLVQAFTHVFILTDFFVALDGDRVASMCAITDGIASPIQFDMKTLRKHLGFFRGILAKVMLTKFMVNQQYPFEITPSTGSVSFVAASIDYRGKGVTRELIDHAIQATPYQDYVLEVASNNESAQALYQRLGFIEFTKVPAPKKSGFEHLLYLRRVAT